MPFADYFSAVAAHYAEFRPVYPDAMFTWLAGITPRHGLAWDCACGNGQAAHGLAKRFTRIIATDASEAQISAATPDPEIEYRVAPAEASGLPEKSVDLVTVGQALHWFNIEAFYAEVRRVTKPDGVLAVWAYDFASLADASINACMKDFRQKTLGPYWPKEVEHIGHRYRTLPFPFKEMTAPVFPLEASWTLAELLGHFRSWSAPARFIKEHGHDPVSEAEKELALLWGAPNSRKHVTWSLFMRAGRV